MPKKIYCGIGKVPKNSQLGSMKECAEKGAVRYWGLKKVDPKLIEAMKRKSSKKESRDKLAIKMVGLRGRVNKLKKDISGTKDKKQKAELEKKLEQAEKDLSVAIKNFKKADAERKQSRSRKGSKRSSRKSSRKSRSRSRRQSKRSLRRRTSRKSSKKRSSRKK